MKDEILFETNNYKLLSGVDKAGDSIYLIENKTTKHVESLVYILPQAINYMVTIEKALLLAKQDLKEHILYDSAKSSGQEDEI
jgi:hypothetical protein